ncbi:MULTISPECIES: succinylglutamate desuccinylase/aspartoacylase domain-containing protein [Salinibaculum]|uniref:succinylglutamate desuccinylase/aspartoacylase domain-containing protein n=1 Tax=Salinibaculum TaxID=2732368 RepID=UPI0030D4E2E1
MRVERLGDGEPEVAIVGGIHGDEPCGVRAVDQLVDDEMDVQRPVALVVANEEAVAAGKRYLDADLNRSFPGDPTAEAHEERLAAELTELLADCEILSLHSTQSYEDLFAIVNGLGEFERHVCPSLTVHAVVDAGSFDRGRIFASLPRTVEVECGYQGSDQAATNAYRVAREFLGATGALPEEARTPNTDLPLFRLHRRVPKEPGREYEVYAANFQAVEEGEAFAAMGGEDIVAEERFYPVLMSPYGYETVFGYAAERLGTLADV